MIREIASRELSRIETVPMGGNCGVWLRKGIRQTTITNEYGDEEAVWVADEVIFGTVDGTPEPAWLEDNFDALWERFAEDAMTDAERIADARETASTNGDAIAELAEMVAEGEVTMEDLAQAIVELAEIVGGGE